MVILEKILIFLNFSRSSHKNSTWHIIVLLELFSNFLEAEGATEEENRSKITMENKRFEFFSFKLRKNSFLLWK